MLTLFLKLSSICTPVIGQRERISGKNVDVMDMRECLNAENVGPRELASRKAD